MTKVCVDCWQKFSGRHSFCESCRKKYNHRVRQTNKQYKINQEFLHSSSWRKCRARILARDDHTCQFHLFIGQVRKGKHFPVDHIVPRQVAPEREYDETNLLTLCPSCHNRKSRLESDGYVPEWTAKANKFVVVGNCELQRRVRLAALNSDIIQIGLIREEPTTERHIMLSSRRQDGFILAKNTQALWIDLLGAI